MRGSSARHELAFNSTDYWKDGMTTHLKPYERYYGDVSREKAEAALSILQPMAKSAFTTPTSYAGWRDYGIPCTYVKCLQDQAVVQEVCDMYETSGTTLLSNFRGLLTMPSFTQ